MQYVETTKAKVNQCACGKSHTYVVNGSKNLYTLNDSHEIILPIIRKYEERPRILQSILVFCSCGKLTIHYPILSNTGAGWKSRRIWKGWRNRHIKIDWPYDLPAEQRTLSNVHHLLLTDSDGSIEKGFYFVSNQSDDDIDIRQTAVAEKVFQSLLTCVTYRGFRVNIDYRIRECAQQGMLIASGLLYKHQALQQVLPALVQEVHNQRHSMKSVRLQGICKALQNLCVQTGTPMPRLITKDTGQPEIIKQLVVA